MRYLFNEKLADRMLLSVDEKNNLNKLYEELHCLINKAANTSDTNELSEIDKSIEVLELEMQKQWKFEPSKNKCSYWYQIPGCTCPKLDNAERWGTPNRIYTVNCPVHSYLFGTK